MSGHILYDAVDELDEINLADYTALVHFFPCYAEESLHQVSAVSKITDVAGGVVIDGLQASATLPTSPLVIQSTAAEYPLAVGSPSWAVPAGRNMIMVMCCGAGANNFNIGHLGDNTETGIQILGATGQGAVIDGRAVAASKSLDQHAAIITGADMGMYAAVWENGVQMEVHQVNAAGTYSASGTPETTLAADIDLTSSVFSDECLVSSAAGGFKGLMLWMFDSDIPSDIEKMLQWSLNEWHTRNNRGAVWPAWKGLS